MFLQALARKSALHKEPWRLEDCLVTSRIQLLNCLHKLLLDLDSLMIWHLDVDEYGSDWLHSPPAAPFNVRAFVNLVKHCL